MNLHHDVSIREWLEDLKIAAHRGVKVDRFLLISGDRYGDGKTWDYKLLDDKAYKDKLFEVIRSNFITDIDKNNYKIYCVLCGLDVDAKISRNIFDHFTIDLPSFKKIRAANKFNEFLNMRDELHSNWVMFNCKPYSILQYEEIFEYHPNESLPVFYYHEEGTINGRQQTCDMTLKNPQMLSNRCVRYMIYYETLIEAIKFAAHPQYKKENYVFPLTNELFNK